MAGDKQLQDSVHTTLTVLEKAKGNLNGSGYFTFVVFFFDHPMFWFISDVNTYLC